jgi:predicted nucleic-acid-binding protein
MTVLLDTNILLDYFQNRPEFLSAEKILNLCADKKIAGYIAAHSIPDMYYIMRKTYTEGERRSILLNLIQVVSVIAVDQKRIVSALSNTIFPDFEDCLQAECASSFSADYIITRNIKDFLQSSVKALSPQDFLNLIEKPQQPA